MNELDTSSKNNVRNNTFTHLPSPTSNGQNTNYKNTSGELLGNKNSKSSSNNATENCNNDVSFDTEIDWPMVSLESTDGSDESDKLLN